VGRQRRHLLYRRPNPRIANDRYIRRRSRDSDGRSCVKSPVPDEREHRSGRRRCGRHLRQGLRGRRIRLERDSGTPLPAFLSSVQADTNIAGDLFWDLWPHAQTYGYDQHSDGFTLHGPGDTADMQARAQELRAHAYAMSGLEVPPHQPVGAPTITLVTPHRQIGWHGVAGGDDYSVEESTISANGPWTTICSLCATDNSTPWQDPNPLEGASIWYRVQADNLDGKLGPWSAAYQFGA
jgi:hypothetical protein